MYKDIKGSTNESGGIMPSAAIIERDREQYCNEMEEYFRKLKELPKEEITKVAKKNLIDAGIIDKNGNLTEHYSNSR